MTTVHPLSVLKSLLLSVPNPAPALRIADEYLRQYAALGSAFVLPQQYAQLKPIIDYYAGDLPGWVKFVRGIRDSLPKDGRTFHTDMHDLYRTLEVRLTQQERRDRLDSAVQAAVRKGIIPDEPSEKLRYSRRCTQHWKLRRDALLKAHAAATGKKRLSMEERDDLLTQFWTEIQEEISIGVLPPP